jgi:hypothetical protein
MNPSNPEAPSVFQRRIYFYGEQFLGPRLTLKLEDHRLSAVRRFLFNILDE